MKRILTLAAVAAAIVGFAPAGASAAYSHEATCTGGLANTGNRNTAAFYNNARWGAGNWAFYSAFGGFDYAANSVERQSSTVVYCHGSYYARSYASPFSNGNRCQFFGNVTNDVLVHQHFEQCFNF